jgi:hypothetical protein
MARNYTRISPVNNFPDILDESLPENIQENLQNQIVPIFSTVPCLDPNVYGLISKILPSEKSTEST